MIRAARIVPPPTAFRTSARKQPREQDGDHLAFIRMLSCLVSGRRDGIEAAHVRYGDALFAKRETGKGEKPSDCWAVPLHRDQHRDQHARGDEAAWWRSVGIDPLQVALALHRVTGHASEAEAILDEARRRRLPRVSPD